MEAAAMTATTRCLLAIACLASCFQPHPADQREVSGEDCYGCHAADYAATTAPVHRDMPTVFSTACTSCHVMVRWQPALEGKHSDVFVIAEGPHATPCLGCHDLAAGKPSTQGANTNCLPCHPNDAKQIDAHRDIEDAIARPYAYLANVPNFCLDCHPAGLGAVHPEQRFALRKDHDVPCAECHDRAAGKDTAGANVTCVESRCHHTLRATDDTDGHKDGDYQKARGSGASRNFCHKCHA
jgi:hypothetical protein